MVSNEICVEVLPIFGLDKSENPHDYIILPSKKHGSRNYPDLMVSKHRLGLSEKVKAVGSELKFSLEDFAMEFDGKNYINTLNWRDALTLNLNLGNINLNLRRFVDFLHLLYKGSEGKEKVYDPTGWQLRREEIWSIYNEIAGRGEKRIRGEYIDASYCHDPEDYHNLVIAEHYLYKGNFSTEKTYKLKFNFSRGTKFFDMFSADVYGFPTKEEDFGIINGTYVIDPNNGTATLFSTGSSNRLGGTTNIINCSYSKCVVSSLNIGIRPVKLYNGERFW